MSNPSNILAWLNFFVADVRDGLGPFLGVFLKSHNFGEAEIGLIQTITQLIALSLGVPFGILVDKTSHKKSLIALCVLFIGLFCSLNFFFPSFYFTLLAQSAIALSGVFLAPALAAITLGIVGQKNYPLQCAHNEAYKHAGTVFGAVICFVLAFYFGIASVFIVTAILGAISLLILGLIKQTSIDDNVACGNESILNATKGDIKPPREIWRVFIDKRVIFISFIMFCFHFSNAAMLPLLSQRAYTQGVDTSGSYAAATVIIAQSTMIYFAFLSGKIIGKNANIYSYFWLLAICFCALIIRGSIAAHFESIGGMVITQLLDGVGAGITGVVLPVFIAIILRGSGHINMGLSIALTIGGIGGALSRGVGGYLAQFHSYTAAYMFLAFIALLGLVGLLLGSRFIIKHSK